MRNYAVSTLFLVFALVTGACAGRQARSVQAPLRAEPTAVSVTAPAAETSVTEPAPAPAEAPMAVLEPAVQVTPVPTDEVQETPAMAASRMIAEHNASVRAAAEKLHRSPVPPTLANNDELVAALRIDWEAVRKYDAERAARDTAFWRDIERQIAAYEAQERAARKAFVASARVKRPSKPVAARADRVASAPEIEDSGREAAVIGSVAAAPPLPEAPAATPPPSIKPAPPRPPPARAAPETPLFYPDPASVHESQAYWQKILTVAGLAGAVGILFGILAAALRARRLRILADAPYGHLPDDTVLLQKVVDGRLVTIETRMPETPQPRSEPEVQLNEALLDEIEKTWHAAGEAMEEDDKSDPQAGTPKNRRFDLTDTPVEPILPQTVPTDTQPTPIPISQPDADDAPRLASGSGKIINSEHALTVSGETPVPPPLEPRSEPDTSPKVIVFEDKSSPVQAVSPASATTPN